MPKAMIGTMRMRRIIHPMFGWVLCLCSFNHNKALKKTQDGGRCQYYHHVGAAVDALYFTLFLRCWAMVTLLVPNRENILRIFTHLMKLNLASIMWIMWANLCSNIFHPISRNNSAILEGFYCGFHSRDFYYCLHNSLGWNHWGDFTGDSLW